MNRGLFRVLAIKPFLFLWLAELFSQIAANMLNFILIIAVFKLTNSNTAVSGVVLSFTVPAILFGIFAGAAVDRMSKKRILFLTNIVRAVLLVILSFFDTNLFIIYLVSFLVTTATQFFIPAETPTIPLLVPKTLLLQANALFGAGIYISLLLAYALTSPLLLLFGEKYTYTLLAVLFAIAAFFISFIKYRPVKKETESMSGGMLVQDMKDTIFAISRSREVFHSLLLLTFFQVLILMIAAIGPGYVKQILDISVEQAPILLMTPAALGMVLGALLIAHYFDQFRRETIATLGVFIIGIATYLLPFGSRVTSRDFIKDINTVLPHYLDITNVHFMIFLMFILGIGGAFIFVPSNTILQEKTSEDFRGKIYGILNTFVGVSSILPVLAVGGLADQIGVGQVLTGMGILVILIGIYRIFFL